MPIINFTPELDLDYYRKSYPELNNFSDNVLLEHYKYFGVEQGRSTCIYDRREFLQKLLQDAIDSYHLKTLEITPWDNPFLHGDNVKYFDAADPETLLKNSKEANRPFNDIPEKIDFISPKYDLGVVDEKFDIVFSSHVIEHTPDLVKHLQSVGNILNKGGLYVLIVPDKRYCLDYYQSESTVAEVIDAFVSKREIPSVASFITYDFYGIAHNNSIFHWLGKHVDEQSDLPTEMDSRIDSACNSFSKTIDEYAIALENGNYIDNHNWHFTPNSFNYIVRVLKKLQFIDLSLYRLCHTIWGRLEFVVMLEKY